MALPPTRSRRSAVHSGSRPRGAPWGDKGHGAVGRMLARAVALAWVAILCAQAGRPVLGPLHPRDPDLEWEIPVWTTTVSLRGSGGWRDNVLLSGTNAQETPFVGYGFEAFVLRMPIDAHRWTLFVGGEERRYLRTIDSGIPGQPVDGDAWLSTYAEYRHSGDSGWSPGLVGQHLYANQVFDASTLADGLGSVRTKVHALTAHPSLRWTRGRGFRAEVGYGWQRQNFDAPLDGFWQTGPRGVVAWDYADQSSVEATVRYEDRPYDSRPAANLLGIPEPGMVAKFTQLNADLAWKHQWSDKPRLRSTIRLFQLVNRDQAVGFYDFDRWGAAGTLRWEGDRWGALVGARWSHWTYPRQFISPAPEDLFKYRDNQDYEANLRLTRKFGRHATVFAEFLWERQDSNVPLFTYDSRTLTGGLEWEF